MDATAAGAVEGIATATLDIIANARQPASVHPYNDDDATAISNSNVNSAAVTTALLRLLEVGGGGGHGVGGSSRVFATFESSLDASFRSWGHASSGLSSTHATSDERAAVATTANAAEHYATLAALRLLAAVQPESAAAAAALSHTEGWSKRLSPADLLSKALSVAKLWTSSASRRAVAAAAEVQEEAVVTKPTGALVCAMLAAAAKTAKTTMPHAPSAACAATAIDSVVTMVYQLLVAARGAEGEKEGEVAEESDACALHDDALAADALATLAMLLEHCADEVAHATRAALEAACGAECAYTLGLALKCGVRGAPLHALLSRIPGGNRAAAALALEGCES
jgi:hypothetical protein